MSSVTYRSLLRTPGAAAFFLTAAAGRVGIAMISLGIVWLVHARTGSYAAAGLVRPWLASSAPAGTRRPARYWPPSSPADRALPRSAVPRRQSLALQLSAHIKKWLGETLLTGADGGQLSTWAMERAVRTARKKVNGLPAGFRYHDLRHSPPRC